MSDLRKIETLTDVDKIEDVLLEAGASKSHAGLQKLGTNPCVTTDGLRNLGHVGPRGLADGGHAVDAGDPLGEEGVGRQLGQFTGPRVHRDDSLGWNPVPVTEFERIVRIFGGLI